MKLVGNNGEIFFEGEYDYFEVAWAMEEYICSENKDILKNVYDIDVY